MNVREYAAQLLALPDAALDLLVISPSECGCCHDDFAEGPEIRVLSASEARDLSAHAPVSIEDVQRVVVLR